MKSKITDELLRQIEIAAMVLHQADYYSEFDLAEHFDNSVQSIRRDMGKLRSMGIEIHSSKGTLSIDKSISLNTLNDILCTYLSLNNNETIRNLKLIQNKFGDNIIYYFVELIKAINDKKFVNITYKVYYSELPIGRTILPLTLSRIGKTIYLIGYENDNPNKIRHYLLERIVKFEFPNIKSKLKYSPDINELFRYSWGTYLGGEKYSVKLLFTKETGEDIKDKFYIENQQFQDTKEGYIMTLEVNLTYEFISWVMGFGDEVKVIKPKVLIQEITERAKEIIKNYK